MGAKAKDRWITVFVVGVLALAVLASGCVISSTATSSSSSGTLTSHAKTVYSHEGYLTVTDMLGRTVKVPVNVTRVVAIGPGALRILVYLNATGYVCGVEEFEKRWQFGRPYILAHPELLKLPVVGPGGPGRMPNLEEIVKVHPQVVFMVYFNRKSADEVQQKTGIPVVVLSYGNLRNFTDPTFFKSLLLAGKVLHKEKRAREVINFLKKQQEDLENRVSGLKSPPAYVGGIGFKGAHGIESTYCDYAPFTVLHVNNIAAPLYNKSKWGWIQISKSWLLRMNPSYIFIDEGGINIIENDYKHDPEFYNSLQAVKKRHLYGVLPYNFYNTNIGIAIADAYYIGKVLYPGRFKDVDPIKKANQIFSFLVGKPVYKQLANEFGGFGVINLKNGKVAYGLPSSP